MIYHIFAWVFFMSGLYTHYIAQKAGYKRIGRVFWATMGFYFGPIAIIPLIILKRYR